MSAGRGRPVGIGREDDIISRLGRLTTEVSFREGDHVYLHPVKSGPESSLKLRGRITKVNCYGTYSQTKTYDTDIVYKNNNPCRGLHAHWLTPVPAIELLGEVSDEASTTEEDHQGCARQQAEARSDLPTSA